MTPERLEEIKKWYKDVCNNVCIPELLTALEEAWAENRQEIQRFTSTVNRWRERAEQAEAEVERLEDLVLRVERKELTQICSYCAWEAPPGGASWDELQAHIKVCPKHPLRAAEAERDKQRRHRKWLVQELHGLQDAYNTLEDDRDKWMGQFDEAEHRGLAYMEERDKLAEQVVGLKSEMAEMVPIEQCIPQEHYDELAARVKLLESDLKNSYACWNAACEDITKYKARVKKLAAKLKEYEAFNEPLRRTYNENTAEEVTP